MKVTVNGKAKSLTEGTTLLAVVADVTGRDLTDTGQPADGTRLGVAVAHNWDIARRAGWHAQLLDDGDDVEVVTAVQGG
ncbi:sulfur carrier protein ThiS [Arthrobacter roseus]|uniref:sulfur carrier protein ThiS n=1 Tax=Arthrobacter roseus TaxID=136274 RepID=UPI00196511F7|nr:sulfur carrier protein ThiS [Arthrobacter roseus]MBM7849172.1 sulfur carrier protein [Arthrobacter roseus]